MSQALTEAPPKFCSDCGAKRSPEDKFCGGCGRSCAIASDLPSATVNEVKQISPEVLRDAGRAAYALGGTWTVINRVKASGASILMARVVSLAWLLVAIAIAVWWGFFAFSDRSNLEADLVDNLTFALVALTLLGIYAGARIARRATDLAQDAALGDQKRQARVGIGIHLATFALGLTTLALDPRVDGAIQEAKAQRRTTEQAAELAEIEKHWDEVSESVARERERVRREPQ